MKLKGFNKRVHNILFHTHTVAGIVISFALYIIFFAGAFALFMDEAYRWEYPESRYPTPESIDLDRAFHSALASANIDTADNVFLSLPSVHNPEIHMYASQMSTDSSRKVVYVSVNTLDYEANPYYTKRTHMMETLYRLHYFRQIPYGIYISGFTALFFLFATITGLLIHWKDIIEKFYSLRTKNGRKNLWKDAHTTLGLIGLPFQIIYGLTGSLLGLSILLLAPSVLVIFDGSQEEVAHMLDPFSKYEVDSEARRTQSNISLGEAYKMVRNKYPEYQARFMRIRNYGTEKAVVRLAIDDHKDLTSDGAIVVDLHTAKIVDAIVPKNKGILASFSLVSRLHYATFGGIWMKVIYFLLSMSTCFIIISGVLLWQSARDNKKYTTQQRRFHHRVTKTYLNICYALFPAVALIFIANITVPFEFADRIHLVDRAFFISWLIFLLSGYFYDSYRDIARHFLILGGVLSFLIPLANGWVTGDWIWKTITTQHWHVAMVDLFWIVIGITCLSLIISMKRKAITKPHP